MTIAFNGTGISAINFNGVSLTAVNFNGVQVWSSAPLMGFSPPSVPYDTYLIMRCSYDGSCTIETESGVINGRWSTPLELNKPYALSIKNNGSLNSSTQDLGFERDNPYEYKDLTPGLTVSTPVTFTAASPYFDIIANAAGVSSGSFTFILGSSSSTFTVVR